MFASSGVRMDLEHVGSVLGTGAAPDKGVLAGQIARDREVDLDADVRQGWYGGERIKSPDHPCSSDCMMNWLFW